MSAHADDDGGGKEGDADRDAPPPWPWSRARTLVDSGGSLMCDALVGSDQSEGEELKMVVDECERIEPKYILRGASVEVRAAQVVAEEDPFDWVTLDEVLGRGGGEPAEPSLSSSSS